MNEKLLSDLISLSSIHSVSGNEAHRPGCSTDAMGNSLRRLGRGGRRILLSVPGDRPGLLATFIGSDGRIRISAVGSPNLNSWIDREVISGRKAAGRIEFASEEKAKQPKDSDLRINIGAHTREEAAEKVSVGDFFTLSAPGEEKDGLFRANGAGQAACAIVADRLSLLLSDIAAELYILYAAQSSLGFRGSKTAAAAIRPDISVSLFPCAFDESHRSEQKPTPPGSGPVLLLRDGSAYADPKLYPTAVELAEGGDFTERVSRESITDGSVMYTAGARPLMFGLPTADQGSADEGISPSDIEEATRIIGRLILTLAQRKDDKNDR